VGIFRDERRVYIYVGGAMSIREKIRIIVENYDTYDCENRTCPKDIDDCDVCISDRILAYGSKDGTRASTVPKGNDECQK